MRLPFTSGVSRNSLSVLEAKHCNPVQAQIPVPNNCRAPARGTERRSPNDKLDCLAVFRLSSVRNTANNAYNPLIAQCSLNNGASDKSFFTFSVSLSFFPSSMPGHGGKQNLMSLAGCEITRQTTRSGVARNSDSTCNCSEMCCTASYYDLSIAVFLSAQDRFMWSQPREVTLAIAGITDLPLAARTGMHFTGCHNTRTAWIMYLTYMKLQPRAI